MDGNERDDYATRACRTCAKRKKACDRRLPMCGACASKAIVCDYSKSPPDDSTSPTSLMSQHDSIRHHSHDGAAVKALYFLDRTLYQRSGLWSCASATLMKSYAPDICYGPAERLSIASTYFTAVHPYFPMLVRSRLYRYVLNPLSPPSLHTELLMRCMDITTQLLPSSKTNMTENEIYLHTRQCWTDAISSGASSIYLLQAGVLLAFFEFGHAIFPNVLYTTALCTQYATAYDMTDLASPPSGPDWLSQEEQRRAWWALLTLERIVHLGHATSALVTPEPTMSSILPLSDDICDKAELTPTLPHHFRLNSAHTPSMGRFARLAQSAHLLGEVYSHMARQGEDEAFGNAGAAQVSRTITALIKIIDMESLPSMTEYCAPFSLCYCGLIILLRSFRNATPELEALFAYSLRAVREKAVRVASDRSLDGLDPFARGTPFALSFLYLAHDFIVNEGIDEAEVGSHYNAEEKYRSMAATSIRDYVQNLTSRWSLASVYVKIWDAEKIVRLGEIAV